MFNNLGKELSNKQNSKMSLPTSRTSCKERSITSASLEMSSDTSTMTREELLRKEAYLKSLNDHTTSSRTRDRLAAVDKQINEAQQRRITSSRTREKLTQKEQELRQIKEQSDVGSVTRERIRAVDRDIEKEKIRSKMIRASAESDITSKTKELSRLREENTRKEVIKLVMRDIANAQITDLAFLVDCTGSMDAYIQTVKNEIYQIVENIREDHPDVKLQVAFVGYRDHTDEKRIETLPFTDNYSEFKIFVGGIVAQGGGDTAEDVFGGLEEAGKLNWKSPCRVLMHFADAPCHGSRFHDGVMDTDEAYNTTDRRGLRIENLLPDLKLLNVRYYFGQINNSTDKMIKEFQKVAGNPNFPMMVNVSDTSMVASAISSSVSCSISATVEMVTKIPFRAPAISSKLSLLSINENEEVSMVSPKRSLKRYEIIKAESSFTYQRTYEVESVNGKIPDSFSKLKDNIEIFTLARTLKISNNPFAEGGQRIAYHALDCSPSLKSPKQKVLKEFKYVGDSYKDYLFILETHVIAEFLVKEFYKVFNSQRIHYLRLNIVKLTDEHGIKKLYTSESLLNNYEEGFRKWTNNTSFVNKDLYSDAMHAFSHWTYEKSGGYLLICDLQGVQEDHDKYVLTDPAMHCTDLLRFGSTNLGPDGMKRFFRSHQCNDVCKQLKLKKRR